MLRLLARLELLRALGPGSPSTDSLMLVSEQAGPQ